MKNLSIVTISLNDIDGLKLTLNNTLKILAQFEMVEQIVIDGGSADGTPDFLEEISGGYANLLFCSECDCGIYDAMNKGAALASGRYILFLNSGDELILQDITKLLDVLETRKYKNADVIGFSYELYDPKKYIRKVIQPRTSFVENFPRMPTSHQAILFRKSLFKKYTYDITYRISGDFEYVCRVLFSNKIYVASDLLLSRFNLGGISSVKKSELFIESCKTLIRYRKNIFILPVRIFALLIAIFVKK